MGLITFTEQGLYCKAGDFYIDPWQPVRRAVITHAHSDHARAGSAYYLAHTDNYYLLKARLGAHIALQTAGYEQELTVNGVKISFFPAGHIIGSAQIRVEYRGEVWVVSGDYKTENDGISPPFVSVRCDTFITESTFGLPIYQWPPQAAIFDRIDHWVKENQYLGRNSVLTAYSLGKAQRLIHNLSAYGYEFYVHGAIYNMHEAIQQFMKLPNIVHLTRAIDKARLRNAIIIVPPSASFGPWLHRWQPYSLGVCSGWMQVRGAQRRRNADAGFALSDHADWPGLLTAIKATGATCVYATHGFSAPLARYLTESLGISAGVAQTKFGENEEEAAL